MLPANPMDWAQWAGAAPAADRGVHGEAGFQVRQVPCFRRRRRLVSACSHGQPGERFFLPKTTGPSAQLKQETFFLALRCAARRLTA